MFDTFSVTRQFDIFSVDTVDTFSGPTFDTFSVDLTPLAELTHLAVIFFDTFSGVDTFSGHI